MIVILTWPFKSNEIFFLLNFEKILLTSIWAIILQIFCYTSISTGPWCNLICWSLAIMIKWVIFPRYKRLTDNLVHQTTVSSLFAFKMRTSSRNSYAASIVLIIRVSNANRTIHACTALTIHLSWSTEKIFIVDLYVQMWNHWCVNNLRAVGCHLRLRIDAFFIVCVWHQGHLVLFW